MRYGLLLLIMVIRMTELHALPTLRIPLDRGWSFSRGDQNQWRSARVPSVVQQDLIRHGLLPDPFYGCNEQQVQWVEDYDWCYKTSFDLTQEHLSYDAAELSMEGLDTYAEVWLNGYRVHTNDNMFVGYDIEVKRHLKVGRNELSILFFSPINRTKALRTKAGFDYPADNDHRKEKLSVYTRKAPYSYGWDWGIRLVTMGIWRPVSIQFYDQLKIEDLYLEQRFLSEERAEVDCCVTLDKLKTHSPNLRLETTCLFNDEVIERLEQPIPDVEQQMRVRLTIQNPKLWMPSGWGEPHLYRVCVRVMDADKIVAEKSCRIGLRTLRLVQQKDAQGESFYFEVNHKPLFIKGANYIPQDAILPQASEQRYRILFEDVRAANMNMLRVWGGGIYEDDLFYDLADENGILIWQDFMFACTTYPHDTAFQKRVEEEAVYNIKRLRNHPCLALWCGNNEIFEGLKYWGWQSKYTDEVFDEMKHGYDQLFRKLLPRCVARWDPQRAYIHTSPLEANWGREWTWGFGDSHNWGVWYGQKPFESLARDIPRFMSEFGFQSFPEMKTISTFAHPDDYDLNSEVMTAHQKSSIGNDLIRTYMERDYRVPEKFEDFVYVGLVMQGRGMRLGMEAHRRNRPYCMGTLYWQLNDSWPVVSWSSIDYYGNWKALHYQAQRAFRDLTCSVTTCDDRLQVWLLSDLLKAQENLELRISQVDFSGRVLREEVFDVGVDANRSTLVFEQPIEEWVEASQRSNTFLRVTLSSQDDILYDEPFYWVRPKDLDLPQVDIRMKISQQDGRCTLELESDRLVKDLYLETSIQGARFSDNFFDLLPCEKRVVQIFSPQIQADQPVSIRTHHLKMTYQQTSNKS